MHWCTLSIKLSQQIHFNNRQKALRQLCHPPPAPPKTQPSTRSEQHFSRASTDAPPEATTKLSSRKLQSLPAKSRTSPTTGAATQQPATNTAYSPRFWAPRNTTIKPELTRTSRRPSPTPTTPRSPKPLPPTRANAWRRSGTASAHAGTSARES